MPAVASTQKLFAHVHVVAFTGTASMALVYETSAIGDYSDAVTRATFTAITGLDKQKAIVAGPITDLNHRFRWTFTGTGTFLVRLAAGIR
jgi:hypothetical protein